MNVHTFAALHSYFQGYGSEIVALHHLPGATEHADGVAVVVYYPGYASNNYRLASLHIIPDAPVYPESITAMSTDKTDCIRNSITDLMCGDMDWTTLQGAMRQFYELVSNDTAEY